MVDQMAFQMENLMVLSWVDLRGLQTDDPKDLTRVDLMERLTVD